MAYFKESAQSLLGIFRSRSSSGDSKDEPDSGQHQQVCSPEQHAKWTEMLHNPKDPSSLIDLLLKTVKRRLDVNTLDNEQKAAPIHSIVQKKRKDRIELLLALLTYSKADIDLKRADDMTALHLVVQEGDVHCAKVLIAFGANVNIVNATEMTPLDLALATAEKLYIKQFKTQESLKSWIYVSTSEEDTKAVGAADHQSDQVDGDPEQLMYGPSSLKELQPSSLGDLEEESQPPSLGEKQAVESEMGELLKSVGAVCATSLQQDAASAEATIPPQANAREAIGRAATYSDGEVSRTLYKDLEENINEMFSDCMSLPLGDVLLALPQQQKELERYKKTGNRILCLDGGGIKGLVQIDILSQIEEASGKKITELFDWIIATSTGGILALAMVYAKKSLRELRQMYLKLKDEVFASPKFGVAFNTEALEHLLKDALGTEMTMRDVTHPKVLIAAVNKEATPLQLHLFNNCFDDQYSDQLIWKVARCTSAAPMFFSEFENYVDGGVLANNPSEVGLTEIQNFHWQKGQKLPISLVVSVGTGVYPVEKLGSIDARQVLYMGKHWLKIKENFFNRLGNLMQLLSNALVESEMVARTYEGSCKEQGIPYYRLSPPLPEMISAGETDNGKLLQMIISTRMETREIIQKLAKLHL